MPVVKYSTPHKWIVRNLLQAPMRTPPLQRKGALICVEHAAWVTDKFRDKSEWKGLPRGDGAAFTLPIFFLVRLHRVGAGTGFCHIHAARIYRSIVLRLDPLYTVQYISDAVGPEALQ